MTAILLISLLVFLASALIISRWQKKPALKAADARYESGRALFENDESPHDEKLDTRSMMLARAEAGDLAALSDSHDTPFYGEVLDHILEWASSDAGGERLTKITSHILVNGQLRTNPALAGLVRECWLGSPSPKALPQMLRVAALSGDAATLEQSIEAAMQSWRCGQLRPMATDELRTLIDAEYWVLSDAARRSGRGNVLKQTLARVHRELAAQRA